MGIEHVDRFPSEGSNWLEARHSGTSAACRKGEEKKESLSERKEWKFRSAQFRQDDRNEGEPSLDSNLDGSLALRLQGLQGPHAVPAGRRAYQDPPQQEDDPSALRAENRKRARARARERERERGREREREKRGHERTAVELTVSHQASRQPPLLPTPPLQKKHLNSSNSSAERSPTSSRQEKKTPPASASRPSSAKNLCSRPSTPSSSTSSSSACAPRCSRSWTRPRRT